MRCHMSIEGLPLPYHVSCLRCATVYACWDLLENDAIRSRVATSDVHFCSTTEAQVMQLPIRVLWPHLSRFEIVFDPLETIIAHGMP